MSSSTIREAFADALDHDWPSIARPAQLPPDGDWRIWLVLAGRGWGKTLTGAQWIRGLAEAGVAPKLALIAPTAADARDVMVQTLLEIAPNSFRPLWEPSKRSLTWPNGTMALAFSSEEPERLRGPQFHAAWLDEMCAWKNVNATWDMLQFCVRVGRHPRQVITTTPKKLPLLQALIKREDVAITKGKTSDNAKNLARSFTESITGRYGGTRLGRQELDAEILLDVEGALWTHEMIDRAREPRIVPPLERVVVAVDPSGTSGAVDGGDSIGIVVAGKADNRCYVLADWTLKASPDVWGKKAVQAFHHFNADRLVAERNFGGAMVEHVIRTVDRNVAYKEVSASRGKVQRAEPVAALYEQGRVHHVGDHLTELEDQLAAMTSTGFAGDGSPDRADALVWALTELMVSAQRPQFIWSSIGDQDRELEQARRHLVRGPY